MSGDARVVISAEDQASGTFQAISAEAVKFGAVLGTSAKLATSAFDSLINNTLGRLKTAFHDADAFYDLSQKVGMSVESLAGYSLATKQTGTSVDAVGRSIKNLSVQMMAHGDAFRKVGIDTHDADKAFRQLADVFASMPDGLEKTALATKLFGREGQNLIPLLNLGSKGLDESVEKSRKYAQAMKELAPQADQLGDTLAEMQVSSAALSANMALELVPALNEITKAMALAVREGGMMQAAIVGIGGVATEMLGDNFKSGMRLAGGDAAKALDLFGGVSPFRTVDEQVVHFRKEVETLRAKLSELQASPFTMKFNLDGMNEQLDKAMLRLAYFEEWQSRNVLAASKGKWTGDARDLRAGADAFIKQQAEQEERGRKAEETAKRLAAIFGKQSTDNSYENLIRQIQEKSSVLAIDSQETTKLTDAQRLAIKVMADLRDGYLQLTNTQKINLTAKLEELLANDKLNQATEGRRKALEKERKAVEEYIKEEEKAQELIRQFIGEGRVMIERTERQREMVGMRERERKIVEATYALEDKAAADKKRALHEISDPVLRAETIDEINRSLEIQKGRLIEATGATYDFATSWDSGVKVAMASYLDEAENAANQSSRLFTDAFKGMEDALVNFVKTGKLDFKSLADSIISDLIRIQVRASITEPLARAMQASGIGSWVGSLFGFGGQQSAVGPATGSVVANTANTFSMPVLPSFDVGTDYVPRDMIAQIHEGERITPKAFNPAIGNGASGVRVEIFNQGTPQRVVSAEPRFDADGMVLRVLINDLGTNGPGAQALANVFGLRRVAA